MLTLILILAATLLAINLRMWSITNSEIGTRQVTEEIGNSTGSTLGQMWDTFVKEFNIFFAQYCVSLPYVLYTRLSIINVTVFIIKYVPTGLYVYKLKDVYLTSRERIKQKETEIEDIQLQIQIVKTKLCVHDAEFLERAEQLRLGAERLRKVRARVRDVIASDDVLRQAVNGTSQGDADDVQLGATSKDEERDFLVDLLTGYKYDNNPKPERSLDKMDCGEHAQTDPNTPENSVYSSLSDVDLRQDCRVKIVKITNVYKVAYLKHYIKQKRLRRATKQALLKKKIESIKNLLEDWQKTLNMVINSKLSLLNIDQHPIDVVSQEAMGDYSKPRGSSDSDSDMRNNLSDMCYDEYSINWAQNSYKPYVYSYEDVPETGDMKDCHDFRDYGDGKYAPGPMFCEYNKESIMMSIVEETNSQLAIEENRSEPDDSMDCLDIVAL